jgi:uncharacterized protein YifE (UPF0438 family)
MGSPELRHDEEEQPIEVKVPHQHHHVETIMKKTITKPLTENWTEKEMEPFFQGDNTELGCIDGRVFDTMGLAGSGILLDRDPATDLPKQEYMDRFVDMAKRGKLKAITWHAGHGGCGAAKLFLKSKGNENPTDEEAAKVAKDFSERLAKKISELSGIKIKVKEAPAHGDHSEGGVYLDDTNKMDLEAQDKSDRQLPNGFMMNPLLTNDPDYVLKEIDVAISIAFGGHGKNHKEPFTEDNKFFIKWARNPKMKLSLKDAKKWEKFPAMVKELVSTKYAKFADRIGDVEIINVPF